MPPASPEVTVCIDGASRGNPGRAAIGVVVLRHGRAVREIGEPIGVTTNNVAEYRALLRALEEAASLGARRVRVQSDSELLVRQLLGQYKVRSEQLVPLHRTARARLRAFDDVAIVRVPREQNRAADALANRALDEEDPAPRTSAGRA
ncbi:MAG TPA: ribonuclease HI family protein [bacterium]|nr:ribonuclease HI family protein [bacterium]